MRVSNDYNPDPIIEQVKKLLVGRDGKHMVAQVG